MPRIRIILLVLLGLACGTGVAWGQDNPGPARDAPGTEAAPESAAPPATQSGPVSPELRVRIESGVIEGFCHHEEIGNGAPELSTYTPGDVRVFRGIPYAAAPVGPLRWKPPQPAPGWEGVRQARRFGTACLQPDVPMILLRRVQLENVRESSEDCLFANVFTTVNPAEAQGQKRPVLVFFHGGSFTVGAGSDPIYDGSNLARQGAVVVTFNYRLGPFGFFAHPDLSSESTDKISGNYGLQDQIFLLQWVRRNIAAFGSDPENVTAFGHASGAGAIVRLMVCPAARGLFQRAILESPGPLGRARALREDRGRLVSAERIGQDLQDRMGLNSLGELRALDARSLLKAANPVLMGPGEKYGPVIDGLLQPQDVLSAWREGKQADIPILIGNNTDDGSILTHQLPLDNIPQYEAAVRNAYGNAAADTLLKLFPAPNDPQARSTARKLVTAIAFLQSSRQLVDAHVRNARGKVYEYYFTRTPPFRWAQRGGVFHGLELFYSFGNIPPPDGGMWAGGFNDTDRALSSAITRAWISFARTGQPSLPADAPAWPASGPDHPVLEMGDTITVRPDPHGAVLEALDRLKLDSQ